ncbi:acyl-CoA dehydrogenase [Bordetella holmesii]|uniref:Acyl-CoA dehydrogenase, N-terminal domain protein n=2 Tax=Bordetella holmesii TaxID=35814 RepID=A0ABN0S0I3_9BORD|nr:acyl-CoA dehydrogenase [Bordetella holmesii]AHV93540.1 acyl-CoA dehydrogenase, N-terminal domain protein [Bordetella holmesii ATCC 51541]EWM45793.1 acyl-CoA dehydrogenase, N-terminal domain protein [Bordetella holmesii 70147]EWM48675.1 acyl-CoA dehydrogenase, N-terminal domain protein [Bordetella holmesii 41130]EWM49922.1 acyl-CoA dehydrogenase, N-terminal domain protein [Bordetella holmesii 35009]AMD44450.1 acyl-CoA dehydrogenase [Bordetella holmesii H558]
MKVYDAYSLFGPLPRQAEFMEAAAGILARVSPLKRLRGLRGNSPGWEADIWRQLAEAGWTSVTVPEALGGLGLGIDVLGAMATAVGEAPLPEPYLGAGVLPALVLPPFADHPLAADLLQSVVSGQAVLGLVWQEEAGELLPSSVSTSVAREGDRIHLIGVKRWVAPVGATGWLVHSRLGESPTLVWVRPDDPGVRVDNELRVDGSMLCTLHLDTIIPESRMIGQGARVDDICITALETARLLQCSELYGIARRVYTLTLDYLKTRVQFGRPIGANQALQHRMVDAYVSVQVCGALLAESYHQAQQFPQSLGRQAALAKTRIADRVIALCREAVQLHGAIGYTDEYDIGLYLKRALQTASWLGSPRTLLARYYTLRPQRDAVQDEPLAEGKDYNAMSDEAFRQRVRGFLREHYPQALRHVPRRLRLAEVREWYMTLSRHGWLAPAWPREFDGMALSPAKLLIFFEEMEGWGVVRLPDQGIINLGPVLIQHGSAEQKARYLPRILSGQDIWCQGYSEPNAGSDLASLRTEARRDGNHFVVNGQKIWTTLAHDANHIFALVRTDTSGKPQAGISFLLIDLATPGVTIRPITNIVGEQEFCEVFFENVRVPAENLVGGLNQGWAIAKDLLGYERVFAGSPQQSRQALHNLEQLAHSQSLFELPEFSQAYSALLAQVAELEALYCLFADVVRRGELLPASVSGLKVLATETYVGIAREIVRWADETGGTWSGVPMTDGTPLIPAAPFLQSLVTTIYGGSNEIQRNIVAKAVLGL